MVGLGIIGYNPGKKVYTHYGVDNNGWSGYAEGKRSGDSWTYKSTETVEGNTYHTRFTIKVESPTAVTVPRSSTASASRPERWAPPCASPRTGKR